MDHTIWSRIASGRRGLTTEQRALVYHAFAAIEAARLGLGLIKADLEDTIPAELRKLVLIVLAEESDNSNKKPATSSKSDRVNAAREWFISALQNDEHEAISLVLALYDWKAGR